MITIRTDKGIDHARAEARKRLTAPMCTLIFFVADDPRARDYVFRSGGAR